ncbi:MAG: hypothetical protein P1U68_17850 [Verrucomicrobiales bacterium]|nr:hypothetical protein [Verrucomicrobiales bacterium]
MSASSESAFSSFTRHLPDAPELSAQILDLFSRSQEVNLDSLLEEIDSSDYSAVDWAEALVEFDRWLASEKEEARPFPAMIGYVHCCTLTNAPQINLPSLKVIVYQSLTNFGFEAISETHI